MTVVADAGPLIAFAKIDGLGGLFDLYPNLLVSPTVYDEAITVGLALGAADAKLLQAAHEAGRIEVRAGAGQFASARLARRRGSRQHSPCH